MKYNLTAPFLMTQALQLGLLALRSTQRSCKALLLHRCNGYFFLALFCAIHVSLVAAAFQVTDPSIVDAQFGARLPFCGNSPQGKKDFHTRCYADKTLFSSKVEDEEIVDCLNRARETHAVEIFGGLNTFGGQNTPVRPEFKDLDAVPRKRRNWNEKDFISISVGHGNAGPDEASLLHGNLIFQTTQPVFTAEECRALIDEARDDIASGLKENRRDEYEEEKKDRQPTNSELGESRVSSLPRAREWLQSAMQEQLLPLLESRYGIPANELTLYDALVIGYGCLHPNRGASSQPIHRDASLFSLNVALSPVASYDEHGGGTYFEALPNKGPLKMEQGHVMCHAGGVMHAGNGIVFGERWVLVLFVLSRLHPQLSRRCHAMGLEALKTGKLDVARVAFVAGLSLSPRDHILLRDVGQVYGAAGQERTARYYLAATSDAYHACQKATVVLGKMLLMAGRPRAALRRFDFALSRIDDTDLKEGAWMPLRATGWDARVFAARSIVACVERGISSFLSSTDSDQKLSDGSQGTEVGTITFACARLPLAMDMVRVALASAPGDVNLLGLLSRAEELLIWAETRLEVRKGV